MLLRQGDFMIVGSTKLILRRGDITREVVDVIVNAANSGLCGGGGVDGAIHRAGGPSILSQCREIVARQGKCPPGEAVITGGGNLPAKYVVHTVGPIWRGGDKNEAVVLRDAYYNSLLLAAENMAKTIAFPSISTGAYGYPVTQASGIALRTCIAYAASQEVFSEIRFVLFSEADLQVYEEKLELLTAGV